MSPPTFLSKITFVATNQTSCVMVKITFPVMGEVINVQDKFARQIKK